MSKSIHTPGPWKLHTHVNGGQCLVTDDEKMTHIMLISEARGMGRAAKANAKLISVAPEQHEALVRAEKHLVMLRDYASYIRNELMKPKRQQHITFVDLDRLDDVSITISKTKKAIAEATGE